jgi:hypothetical protein
MGEVAIDLSRLGKLRSGLFRRALLCSRLLGRARRRLRRGRKVRHDRRTQLASFSRGQHAWRLDSLLRELLDLGRRNCCRSFRHCSILLISIRNRSSDHVPRPHCRRNEPLRLTRSACWSGATTLSGAFAITSTVEHVAQDSRYSPDRLGFLLVLAAECRSMG